MLDAPLHITRNRLALLLRQRCHDRRDHFTGHSGRVDTLFFEQNADAELLEFPNSRKAVFRISGEAGNGLDQNAVDLSFPAVLHHALKIFALFNRRAGDALIGVNIDHFPIRVVRNKLGIILILDAIGVELIFAGGTDASVGCDAQLPCDDLVVRWDHNDALLFQRKVSAGLLLCHVPTPSVAIHTTIPSAQ